MDGKLSKKSKKELVQNKSEKKTPLNKKKKLAITIIALAVVATAIFAVLVFVFDIGSVRPIKSTDEEAQVVGECAGYSVKYEELRYVTSIKRMTLDARLGSYDSLDAAGKAQYSAALEEMVEEDIKNNYVILSLCDEYGIDTGAKDVRDHVSDTVEALVEELGGKKKYIAWLEENKLTDSFLRLMYKVDYLESKLLERFAEEKIGIEYDETKMADFVKYVFEGKDYVKTIHAYYPKDWQFSDGKSAKVRAESDLAILKSVEDDEKRLSLMQATIGRTPYVSGFSTTGTDFYFTYEQMEDGYEDIAFSLSLYDVELFENEDSYYVIMRVPKVKSEISSRAYEFLEEYRYSVLKRYQEEKKANISFVGNSTYSGITLVEID